MSRLRHFLPERTALQETVPQISTKPELSEDEVPESRQSTRRMQRRRSQTRFAATAAFVHLLQYNLACIQR